MRLRIISIIDNNDKGGLIMVEIIIALSIFSILTISIYSLQASFYSIKVWSTSELNLLKDKVIEMDKVLSISTSSENMYGNFSHIFNNDLFSIVKTDWNKAWGYSSCNIRIKPDLSKIKLSNRGYYLGSGNISTDIEVRNSIVYLTADSANQNSHDLFIIDNNISDNPSLLSSMNTGPGISAIALAGPYVYLANTSSLAQLQILDIHDRRNPRIISQIRLPLPEASTTPTKANSIFYSDGYIYLGTYKWNGPEFYIINVLDPRNPYIVNSFETDTLVNDIYVLGKYAFLATANEIQMRILDISDRNNIKNVYSFSPSGWQTQEGRSIELFENNLALSRTVGGINNINNHEIFTFSTSSDYGNLSVDSSHDIPGGVYGALLRYPYFYLFTHAPSTQMQIWDYRLKDKKYQIDLGSNPTAYSCDRDKLYFSTGDSNGFSMISLN